MFTSIVNVHAVNIMLQITFDLDLQLSCRTTALTYFFKIQITALYHIYMHVNIHLAFIYIKRQI